MKICIVSGGAYSLFNSSVKFRTGGAEKQLYYIGRELAKFDNVEVSFGVGDYGQGDVEDYDGIKVFKAIPISGSKNPFRKIIDGFYFLKVLRKINADVYISETVNISHFLNIIHCRLHRKKFLYMLAHDCEVSYKGNRDFFDPLTALLMEFTYKFADFITFQSEDQRALFQMNRKVKNHDIIKNIFIFKNDDNTVKDYNGGFLWVGRCERWKRPELYLDLAERFPDETFTMICPKTDWKYEFWEEIKARALRISNVKFYDFVNNHEIHKFYREAKIFLITSDIEGFSNTMMEAMSERCPVLSLNVNPDNIIGRYNLGICADGDNERYAAEIDILRKDAAKCREYGNNGYEYLKSEHEAVSITAKLFEIVKGVHERPYVKNK